MCWACFIKILAVWIQTSEQIGRSLDIADYVWFKKYTKVLLCAYDAYDKGKNAWKLNLT